MRITDSKTTFQQWPRQYCWSHVVSRTAAPPSEKCVLLPPVESGWGLGLLQPAQALGQEQGRGTWEVRSRLFRDGLQGKGTGSEDLNGTRHEAGDWRLQGSGRRKQGAGASWEQGGGQETGQWGQMGARRALKGSSPSSN